MPPEIWQRLLELLDDRPDGDRDADTGTLRVARQGAIASSEGDRGHQLVCEEVPLRLEALHASEVVAARGIAEALADFDEPAPVDAPRVRIERHVVPARPPPSGREVAARRPRLRIDRADSFQIQRVELATRTRNQVGDVVQAHGILQLEKQTLVSDRPVAALLPENGLARSGVDRNGADRDGP